MDEAAKPIPPLHPAGRDSDYVDRLLNSALTETLMRPGPMVVVDELRKHSLQVPLTQDQQVVERLAPDCADPPFGK